MKSALLLTLLFAQTSFAWKLEVMDTLDKVVVSEKPKDKKATVNPFPGVTCHAVENKSEVEVECKDIKNESSQTSVDCKDKSSKFSFVLSINDPTKPEDTRLVRVNCK